METKVQDLSQKVDQILAKLSSSTSSLHPQLNADSRPSTSGRLLTSDHFFSHGGGQQVQNHKRAVEKWVTSTYSSALGKSPLSKQRKRDLPQIDSNASGNFFKEPGDNAGYQTMRDPPSVPRKPPSADSQFKVNVKSSSADVSVNSVLSRLVVKGTLPEYKYRFREQNNIDLVFSSLAEAKNEFNKISAMLKDFTVDTPKLARGKRAYLVGLHDFHTEDDVVMKSILRNYSDILQLNGKNKDCLQVEEIKPCNSKNGVYRATLLMSDDVFDIIKTRLHSRLRICMTSCSVYLIHPHIRCYWCQEHGHMRKDCTSEKPVCPKCGGDHQEKSCTNSVIKCRNCEKSDAFKANCMGHRADSNLCPVYKEAKELAEKNRRLQNTTKTA